MKISGKFILKVAGTLTVISLVVAALLGVVNMVTKDKIDAIKLANMALDRWTKLREYVPDDEIRMRFNSNVSPCVVCPTEGDAYLYLVLPVRVFNA